MPRDYLFSQHHLLKSLCLSVCYGHPFQGSADCIFVGLFLCSVSFCSISFYVYVYSNTVQFYLFRLCDIFWNPEMWSIQLGSSFSDHFSYSGSFVVPYRFYYFFSYFFVKNRNFDGNNMSLEISLGRMDILTILSFPAWEHGMTVHLSLNFIHNVS